MENQIIQVLTPLWWVWNGVFLGSLLVIALFSLIIKGNARERFSAFLGTTLLFCPLFLQFYISSKGSYQVARDLPLAYCDVMAIVAALALLTRGRFWYEFALLCGVVAPLQAMLTPGLSYGFDPPYMVTYFVSHLITVFAPFFLTFFMSMRPRQKAIWLVPLVGSLMVPIVMGINHVTSGNYMFLSERPDIDHILNFGPWPFYILIWWGSIFFTALIIGLVSCQKSRPSL